MARRGTGHRSEDVASTKEERGSVDAHRVDTVKMRLGLNRKVKGLEPTISADVAG